MKRLFAVLMAAALFAAVPALAQDPGHVKIAPNNIGDLLIYPFYYADDTGIATKLTVVNTSESQSTVAKVVIKTWVNSKEVLDFLIYLSPADVWTGYIVSLDGTVYLVSFDDSMQDANGRWASEENPVFRPLVSADEGNGLGYVFVVNAATDVALGGGDTQRLGRAPGVEKPDIKEWYELFNDDTPENLTADDPEGGAPIDRAEPLNILAGWMELTYGYLFNIAGLNATTLADYQNRGYISSGESTLLSANTSYTVGGSYAYNFLADIEAVLAKTRVAMPYVNGPFDLREFTVHMFTFPTKDTTSNVRSPFFNRYGKGTLKCINVDRKIYDLTEKSTTRVFSPSPTPDQFCYEVQPIFTFDFPFSEGWARYTFPTGTTTDNNTIWDEEYANSSLTYQGAPVIPTLFDITLGEVFTSLRYGAWDDGAITLSIGGSTVYPVTGTNSMVNYHYSDIPIPSGL